MMPRSGLWILIPVGLLALAGLLWWVRSVNPSGASPSDPGDAYRDRAAALLREDRLDEATRLVEKWRSSLPGDERAVLASAELAARKDDPARAIELYTAAAGSAADPARVWLRIAQLQEAMGQLEAAVESCRRAVSAGPRASEALLRLGDLLRLAGRLDEAEDVLERLDAQSPPSLPVRHALAAVRNGQGRFEEVITLLGPFAADPSLPANAREHYAVALGELGRHAEAAAVWVDLLAAHPCHVEGSYRLGRLYRRLQRPRLSRDLLERYNQLADYRDQLESARKLELSGRRVDACVTRAEAYAATHQVGLALEELRRAVRAPGVHVDAALAAILSLIRLDLLDEARQTIRALRSTASIPAHVADAMSGRTAERAGDLRAAGAAYERALAARPDYRSVLLALAGMRLENDPDGRLTAAAALATRAHEDRADAESSLLMGRIAFAGGDLGAAGEHFETALRLARPGRGRAEARLYLGRIALARRQTQAAASALEEVVAEAPTMAAAWSALADARAASGDGRAADAARRASELEELERELWETRRLLLDGREPPGPLYLRLARLAERSGSRARRIQYLNTALAVDPRSAEACRRLADAYTEPGEVFLRIHALARLVALEPRDAEAGRRLAEARRSVAPEAPDERR